jgi:hypothetical protein
MVGGDFFAGSPQLRTVTRERGNAQGKTCFLMKANWLIKIALLGQTTPAN